MVLKATVQEQSSKQWCSDVCFHCGRSNALDAEARKRKLKDCGIVRPICKPCIASGKEISVTNAKKMRKWNKHIHIYIKRVLHFRTPAEQKENDSFSPVMLYYEDKYRKMKVLKNYFVFFFRHQQSWIKKKKLLK